MNKQKTSGRPLMDYLYAKACSKQIPLNGTFELSPICNFSCQMCYVRQTAQQVACSARQMTLDDWRRIAREAKQAGMLELLLTGGEPLLWPDFWVLYEELQDMGFLVSINTNGSLIDADAVRRFREMPPHRINITLYGADDVSYQRLCKVTGVFAKVDAAIRGLIDAGITVKLNCSLTPDNAEDIDRIVDYAKEKNIVLSVSTYMFPPVRRDPSQIGVNERFTSEESAEYMVRYLRRNRGEEKFRGYMESILKGYLKPPGLEGDCMDAAEGRIRCRAGRASFWVTWDGWMMPCGMMIQPKVDLMNRAFAEAWNALTQATTQIRLASLCEKCSNRKICHPCAAVAYAETGTFAGVPTYRCEAVQKMCEIARDKLTNNEV